MARTKRPSSQFQHLQKLEAAGKSIETFLIFHVCTWTPEAFDFFFHPRKLKEVPEFDLIIQS